MLLSEFTPLELFELSDEEPLAERIYNTMVAAHGGQFDMTVGESRQEAWCFATALSKARAMKAAERAGAQAYAATVSDKIEQRESEFHITPPFDATLPERQAVIAKRRRRPGVWTAARITAALQELLGADFIAYRPTPLAEAARWPAALADQPQNLQRPTVTRKTVRLTHSVTTLGSPLIATYELVDIPQGPGSVQADLVDGDALVVDHGLGLAETVIVSDVYTGSIGPRFFTATFTKPHPNGTLCTTAPFPKWISMKRHSLVVVSSTVVSNPETRRRIDEEMRRMVRASSTWDIVQSFDGLTTNTFQIDEPNIGMQTIGEITL